MQKKYEIISLTQFNITVMIGDGRENLNTATQKLEWGLNLVPYIYYAFKSEQSSLTKISD